MTDGAVARFCQESPARKEVTSSESAGIGSSPGLSPYANPPTAAHASIISRPTAMLRLQSMPHNRQLRRPACEHRRRRPYHGSTPRATDHRLPSVPYSCSSSTCTPSLRTLIIMPITCCISCVWCFASSSARCMHPIRCIALLICTFLSTLSDLSINSAFIWNAESLFSHILLPDVDRSRSLVAFASSYSPLLRRAALRVARRVSLISCCCCWFLLFSSEILDDRTALHCNIDIYQFIHQAGHTVPFHSIHDYSDAPLRS
jgi:hypothetical protein